MLGNVIAVVVSCGGIAFATLCYADEGLTRAHVLAHSCTVCHGSEGNGSLSIPKIRGLDRADFAQSLKEFRSGEEQQTIMSHISKELTDEEIELLATHFSARL
jgi:sulfide dehydrogenase cytochrome subunit